MNLMTGRDGVREFISSSAQATECIGSALGEVLAPGDVVCLLGDLGAGKTCFAQGVGAGLGITADMVSPTFNIALSYTDGRIPLEHLDLYRLDTPEELEDIGFFELVDTHSPSACLIEWADRFPDEIPEDHLEVFIQYASRSEEERCIRFRACGARAEELLSQLVERCGGKDAV